ncbi:MAG: tyrosine-type recombinase/integrase [Sphingobacteriales bacterium]|nr:tyrosine-type recombinase/integrase [Sphingobacteriales bacterium]
MVLSTSPDVQTFLNYLRYEKRYSHHTLISYQNDLIDFFGFLEKRFGSISIKEIDHNMVRSWLAELKNKGLSAKSINRKISSLKSFFKYQLKMGVMETTPMAKVISLKVGKRLPVFVKEEETKKIIEALKSSTDDWKSLNTKMLIAIFYSTGLRLSELINLKEKQVDFARSQLKVLGKGNKERIIPLNKGIMDMIDHYRNLKKKYFEEREERLLVTEKGKKLYPKYAYLLVNRILGEAGSLDKKSPHVLRHTFATHLMNNGADLNAVKELLGHSSLVSTQIYTHNSIEKLKDIHKKAHPKA